MHIFESQRDEEWSTGKMYWNTPLPGMNNTEKDLQYKTMS